MNVNARNAMPSAIVAEQPIAAFFLLRLEGIRYAFIYLYAEWILISFVQILLENHTIFAIHLLHITWYNIQNLPLLSAGIYSWLEMLH